MIGTALRVLIVFSFILIIVGSLLYQTRSSFNENHERTVGTSQSRYDDNKVVFAKAYADGLSFETLPPMALGNKQVSLYESIDPPVLPEGGRSNVTIEFRLFDPASDQTYQNTTYYVRIHKLIDGTEEAILIDSFYSFKGPLRLDIVPTDGFLEVDAEREPYLNAYIANERDDSVTYKTPMFLDGGLYHVRVAIFSLGNQGDIFSEEDAPTFDSWLSIGTKAGKVVQMGEQSYNITIVSYYDVVNDMSFDEPDRIISWSIPFNWDLEKLKAAQNVFVHQEVQIPKSLAGIGDATSFAATVNGNPISGRMLAVDPYTSEQDLILHYLVNKNDIINMAGKVSEGNSKMTFALAPTTAASAQTTGDMVTDTGSIDVAVKWTPGQLSTETESTVKLDFSDAFSGSKINSDVIYDLKILDSSGKEVYSKKDQTAKGGTGTHTIDFPSDESYRIEVAIKGLMIDGKPIDETKNGIARGVVVVPEFQVSIFIVFSMIIAVFLIINRVQFRMKC